MYQRLKVIILKLRPVITIASGLMITLIIMTGCARIRLVTYPDSFVWIDRDTVRSTMHTMAASLGSIENLINSETTAGAHKEQILIELDTLGVTAQKLATGNALVGEKGINDPATNHLLIDDHLDEFTESVLLAQLQAQATPPQYYRAGTLIGSCNACHRFR